MNEIKVMTTNDKNKIKAFMLLDEIWDSFKDDTCIKSEYLPPTDSACLWLNIELNGTLIGMALVNNENASTLNLHPYLLKKYRRHIMLFMKRFFIMFLKTPDFINKLMVLIPFDRKIVYNTAKKAGFIDEGIDRFSVLRDGIFISQWRLGLTKKEVKILS